MASIESEASLFTRRRPVGAEIIASGGAHFRVWAPASSQVSILLGGQAKAEDHALKSELQAEEGGYFSGHVSEASAGMDYRILLDSGAFPDPASRFQPQGPHGPSRLVDPATFSWTDQGWNGLAAAGQVIYELHIGTFTKEGTWRSAMEELAELARLGVTTLEIMPVADFAGTRGWGYDGVNLFAPTRIYGQPDDFRAFVNAAHDHGLAVILDIVYNHLGPSGNYLPMFSRDYFHRNQVSDWGDTLNFDGENSDSVRELFITNAGYWIEEFHLDGLRLDAVHQIFDESRDHLLKEIGASARKSAGGRSIFIVAENEYQQGHLLRSAAQGGYGLDAAWNDDFHHSAMVAMTSREETFFSAYYGSSQELLSSMKWGFLYQGQRSKWQKGPWGSSALDLSPYKFVCFLQNHDQVASPLLGRRIHTVASPRCLRAMTAMLLLGPNTPMLFQGQEFASSAPFFYFVDYEDDTDLASAIAKGRSQFLAPFSAYALPRFRDMLEDPQREETFLDCKLDFSERESHEPIYTMHRDLIQLRLRDPLISRAEHGNYDGSVLGPKAFVLRYIGRADDDRLLIVNMGEPLRLDRLPEPLLAPVTGHSWQVAWSSEDVRYGGEGTRDVEKEDCWDIPGETVVLLTPRPL